MSYFKEKAVSVGGRRISFPGEENGINPKKTAI
jgi:hypothetical protein